MKIENSKLRKQLEKSENQRRSLNLVLNKTGDEIKQKDELIKKHTNYIGKLENQLIKGTFNLDLIEGNKKLEDKISNLEREIKEFECLNQALKTKLSNQEKQLTILNSCLVKNINGIILNFFKANQLK